MADDRSMTNPDAQSSASQNGDRIISVPGICGGDARVRGTRIPVWGLQRAKQCGSSDKQIIAMYPQLSSDDLVAAWEYAKSHEAEIAAQIRINEEV